ncbi:LysR family transcriptional regulator [Arenibaculum sp.]|jgi:DNA-binding transcriptional LysR family regulator|uniref:LysR family transcriptional regulator n=1 Tax=Arenibaculum sp. TaxID=2865862 RepID=UPI002E10A0BB|nr:LysR family transcriptional regulator [Arenibaculum sp.]
MNVDLDGFRAFVAVAELGSFHDAANALNISQPALSRRVQKLEEALGAALFDRTTRRVHLTTVGRDFLPKARRLLDELESSLLGIRELAERRSGQVTIACIPTATYYFLPTVIRAYNAQYPRIRIRILDLTGNEVLERVISGEADFGLSMLGSQDAELEFEALLDDPFVLACRHDHAFAAREAVSWRELAGHPFITVGRQSGNRLLLDNGLAGCEWRPRWFYEVQHLATSLGLVEAGLGVAAVPKLAMPGENHPILTSRPLLDPLIRRTIGVIRRRATTLSPAADVFHSMLLEAWSHLAGGAA